MQNITRISNGIKGAFVYTIGGEKMAEMGYTMAGEKKMIIEHTEVDASLKGQGIGKQLLNALVDHVRENDIKVIPLCPFANATFKRVAEWQDVLK